MVEHVDVAALKAAIDADEAHVVDVRERWEYDQGHVPGAVHIPMAVIPLRKDELPTDRPVYLICQSGNRSFQVGLWLERQGIASLNVLGGTGAWRWSGWDLVRGSAA